MFWPEISQARFPKWKRDDADDDEVMPDTCLYIDNPLICAPLNEMGVVFLFGAMAERLGFLVLRIQTEFPDCEALRMIDEDRCQLVKVEFEHQSRNFLKHMHEVDGCDVLVCWKHNWPECPLEVVELRTVLSNQLPAFSQEMLAADLRR
jgi:hypothetical protein